MYSVSIDFHCCQNPVFFSILNTLERKHMIFSLEKKTRCLSSTATATTFGSGRLQMQHIACSLDVHGKGSVTEDEIKRGAEGTENAESSSGLPRSCVLTCF